MVNIKSIIIISVLGLAALAIGAGKINAPERPEEKPLDTFQYHLKGKVIEEGSGTEIGGARVAAVHVGKEIGTAVTQDDGTYDLKFETIREFTGSELEFQVTREGFIEKKVTNIPLRTGEPLIVNFKIKLKPPKFRRDKDQQRWETIEYLRRIQEEGG